jgi:[ribosomal protein S5]-alanine N-acetyltransferase
MAGCRGCDSMLSGKVINLRTVYQSDLEELYARHVDIVNRGDFFPMGIISERRFRQRFQEDGFWAEDEGMLLILNAAGSIVGHIEFFKTVSYLDELELSYQIYEQASRGQGYATEAVQLLVCYLFERLKVNRIRLIIHPENRASCRVAEKCGFTRESRAYGAWYHRGKNHDVDVYALLRHALNCVP